MNAAGAARSGMQTWLRALRDGGGALVFDPDNVRMRMPFPGEAANFPWATILTDIQYAPVRTSESYDNGDDTSSQLTHDNDGTVTVLLGTYDPVAGDGGSEAAALLIEDAVEEAATLRAANADTDSLLVAPHGFEVEVAGYHGQPVRYGLERITDAALDDVLRGLCNVRFIFSVRAGTYRLVSSLPAQPIIEYNGDQIYP